MTTIIKVQRIEVYYAKDVMEILGVGQTKAYQIIKELNQELKDKGKLTVGGRVSKKYFEERTFM